MPFLHAIVASIICSRPADVADTAAFSAGLLNPEHPVPSLIKGQIARRYAVYRNNVTVGLIRALEANFPVVRRLLGQEYFAGFARDFAQIHPPQSPLMFRYGSDFPDALECAEDLVSYPYLADVARLEILWLESYHAADASPLAADALAAIDPEILFDCHLKKHPAARLVQSPFAVHAIFAANGPDAENDVLDPMQPQCILVTRPHYNVAMHPLTPEQFGFFHALMNSESLGDALDRAASIEPNFDLPTVLALMLQSGAFQSIQQGNKKTS
jgi:Putative DNA-binding domain